MSAVIPQSRRTARPHPIGISGVSVAGFKSIHEEQSIEIRYLTILAGANSSGKSSMMQPALLLKQTLEAQYDPGPLLLNGPNAKFTSTKQFLSASSIKGSPARFIVGISLTSGVTCKVGFKQDARTKKFDLDYNKIGFLGKELNVNNSTKLDSILQFAKDTEKHIPYLLARIRRGPDTTEIEARISRNRCFYDVFGSERSSPEDFVYQVRFLGTGEEVGKYIQEIIHLPGLRGNPERSYPVTAIGPRYPGTFETYVASLIAKWGIDAPLKVQQISEDLSRLGLTWKVEAKPVDDTQVEIRVGRLKRSKQGGAHDVVNIADVGFGVSQTLPVVVALRAAMPEQLVYVEQPEIHLHPKAQVAMASLISSAASRKVRVVVETHSSLLLLSLQAIVAEGGLSKDFVKLNWFQRDDNSGNTRISSADLDEVGRFGDWPEDFGSVALEAENHYLTAAEDRLMGE